MTAGWKFMQDVSFSDWLLGSSKEEPTDADLGAENPPSPTSNVLLRLNTHLRETVCSFLDINSAVQFGRSSELNRDEQAESKAFDQICKDFYEEHFEPSQDVDAESINWSTEVQKQLSLSETIKVAYQEADLPTVEKCLASNTDGKVPQRLLLDALFHIAEQKPVQSASRRAFIFSLVSKRVVDINKLNQNGKTLLAVADAKGHKHYVRLLKNMGATYIEESKAERMYNHSCGIVRRKRLGLNKENNKGQCNGLPTLNPRQTLLCKQDKNKQQNKLPELDWLIKSIGISDPSSDEQQRKQLLQQL